MKTTFEAYYVPKEKPLQLENVSIKSIANGNILLADTVPNPLNERTIMLCMESGLFTIHSKITTKEEKEAVDETAGATIADKALKNRQAMKNG